jgi:hypothetical protein
VNEEEERQARVRRIANMADAAEGEAIRRIEETGELSHLYGRPLEMDDDPDWLVTRTLKQQGFSHPLLERARELDEPRAAAERPVARLRRRHAWLTRPGFRPAEESDAFNEMRARTLERYEVALNNLNRAIRDYNLGVPAALHQRPISVANSLEQLEREIPRLAPTEPARASVHGVRRVSPRGRGAGGQKW